MSNTKGFFLIEALLAMLILSVTVLALIGASLQALKVSKKATQITEAILQSDALLFNLENGLRPDWVYYGSKEDLKEGYRLEITSTPKKDLHNLTTRLIKGRDSFDFDLYLTSEVKR